MFSSVEALREFIREEIAAAEEELLEPLRRTIVLLQESNSRQRTMLESVLRPDRNIHSTDVCKQEEVLGVQERSSSLDQEDPEPPQIKEEPLELKQDTDALMVTPNNEERDHTEDQTICLNSEETVSAPEEQSDFKMPVIISVVSESNRDHQLLSNNSHLAERQDQKGDEHVDIGSTKTTESKPKKRPHGRTSQTKNEHNSIASKTKHNTNIVAESLRCNICGKTFSYQSKLKRHMRTHTGEKPFICETCGKNFRQSAQLTVHNRRAHSGEKPYICNTCGERFFEKGDLTKHMRIHSGEKPYICRTCGKAFRTSCSLTGHMRTHTGEKPFTCETCGKDFRKKDNLTVHKRTHTGEKPYTCNTCGRAFLDNSSLTRHMRTHTGEKPFSCETCGKDFRQTTELTAHKRRAHKQVRSLW